LVCGPSRRNNRSIEVMVMETQPAVGEKLVRARCRNTALPRPAMRGGGHESVVRFADFGAVDVPGRQLRPSAEKGEHVLPGLVAPMALTLLAVALGGRYIHLNPRELEPSRNQGHSEAGPAVSWR